MALKVNPANVVSLLLVRYSFFGQVSAITDEERSFAERIAGITEDCANFADFEIEHNEELQIDDRALWEGASDDEEYADDDDDEGDIDTSAPSSETDYAPSTSKKSLRTIPDIYFPHVPDRLLLILDSWNGHKDTAAIAEVTPQEKSVTIKIIPPKATPLIQPPDRFFFRMWKDFIRKISDRIILDNLDVNLFQRDSTIKLQSLTHNQFRVVAFLDRVVGGMLR